MFVWLKLVHLGTPTFLRIQAIQFHELRQAVSYVKVFYRVKNAALLPARKVDSWIHGPFRDRFGRQARIKERLPKRIGFGGCAEPVAFFGEALKRTR